MRTHFKTPANHSSVIPAPFGLELMAEREAGIQAFSVVPGFSGQAGE
jgi:hypothetical protein